ncbi:MAG: hypothetical protein TR69_WS6001001218 [candidate division WS6 bacterium OLB20]|uniref:Uncharacterized protein n=1 Tax=candidate division WS6 bacterium OLB20 TaxID=1617426 RepID=A0A136LX51_9BACT|nr:MAG: hypothetical protein TR69_WS6001001218 [candidate division WS6 bacterium OLB20]
MAHPDVYSFHIWRNCATLFVRKRVMEQTGRVTSVEIPTSMANGLCEQELHMIVQAAQSCVAREFADQFGGQAPDYFNDYMNERLPGVIETMLQNPQAYINPARYPQQDDASGEYAFA